MSSFIKDFYFRNSRADITICYSSSDNYILLFDDLTTIE